MMAGILEWLRGRMGCIESKEAAAALEATEQAERDDMRAKALDAAELRRTNSEKRGTGGKAEKTAPADTSRGSVAAESQASYYN